MRPDHTTMDLHLTLVNLCLGAVALCPAMETPIDRVVHGKVVTVDDEVAALAADF